MSFVQIVFILAALFILIAALRMVTTGSMVQAALWLVATLFGVAILFVLLEAPFLAVVQVVIYIGAIAIMFIFAVMLTRRELLDKGPQLNTKKWIAAALGVVTFVGLALMLATWRGFDSYARPLANVDSVARLGDALLSPDAYLLPFEVASVLLLAALVGSVYVSINKK
jgi:NADH-quinone oxidoreductase subunit J